MALRRSLHTALRLLSSRAAGPSPHSAAAPPPAAAAARAPFSSSSSPPPAEEESLEQIRARIFGTHIGDGRSTGRKLLRSALAGPAVAAWYPPEIVDPLFLDVDDTRRKAKLERLKRRGKVAPKKGEGRRAGKKK